MMLDSQAADIDRLERPEARDLRRSVPRLKLGAGRAHGAAALHGRRHARVPQPTRASPQPAPAPPPTS
jgi:hypothetical protein